MTLTERQDYARTMFIQYPDLILGDHREAILNGQVQIGMTPFEAKLAGGSFAFKVVADTSRWPANVDPYKVMWEQSVRPDKSEIWMTFKNTTQYPGESDRTFRVYFHEGKATEIEELGGGRDE